MICVLMTFVYNLVTFVFGSDIGWKWNGVTGVIIKVNLIKNDTPRVRIINPIEFAPRQIFRFH